MAAPRATGGGPCRISRSWWSATSAGGWSTRPHGERIARPRYRTPAMATGRRRRAWAARGWRRARRWGAPSTIAVALRAVAACEDRREDRSIARGRWRWRGARPRAASRHGRGPSWEPPCAEADTGPTLARRCAKRSTSPTARRPQAGRDGPRGAGAPRERALAGLRSAVRVAQAASERRVARMAAEGLANREIGPSAVRDHANRGDASDPRLPEARHRVYGAAARGAEPAAAGYFGPAAAAVTLVRGCATRTSRSRWSPGTSGDRGWASITTRRPACGS